MAAQHGALPLTEVGSCWLVLSTAILHIHTGVMHRSGITWGHMSSREAARSLLHSSIH